jgi:IclR family transcriptional regulator, KDG regulon repressor
MANGDGATGVRSVQLALDVLEAVACSNEELGVTQISARVDATKGSVHRHLVTLVERGYLAQNPVTARYRIGARSHLLSRLAPNSDLAQIAEGPMRELRDTLGHTVVLSSMTPRGALVMSTIGSTSSIEIGVRPGSELSFHASAQGKVLLAFAPLPFRNRALTGPLQAFTTKTIVDGNKIADELAAIAEDGYAGAPEQSLLGISALAAPVFDHSAACVGAVAIVGSIQFLPAAADQATIAALKSCGRRISRKLEHGGSSSAIGVTHQPRPRRKAG